MKEVMIRLEDSIIDSLVGDAKDRGVPIQELIRGILGEYVLTHVRALEKISGIMQSTFKDLDAFVDGIDKKFLKMEARSSGLTCKNCTMKLTEKDVEDGKCNSCGAPLAEAVDEGEEDKE